MPLRSFGAALFLAIFSVQVSVSGMSVGCAMDEHAQGTAAAGGMANGMVGMDMAEMPAQDESCDHPPSSQDCLSMAPCGVSFVLPASGVNAVVSVTPFAAIVASALAPQSISLPPEPPPPRA